jgi:uncharacterized protein
MTRASKIKCLTCTVTKLTRVNFVSELAGEGSQIMRYLLALLLLCIALSPGHTVPPKNYADWFMVEDYPVTTDGLLIAIGHNEIAIVTRMLNVGVALNKAGEFMGDTPLVEAVSSQHTAIVTLLLERGADVNLPGLKEKKTALHQAAGVGNEGLVQLLLKHGAQVEVQDKYQRTPLHEAAFRSLPCTRILLDRGAQVNARDRSGLTPLMCAVVSRKADIARLLLERGANLDMTTKRGETALILAIVPAMFGAGFCGNGYYTLPPDIMVVRALLEKRPALDVRNKQGYTALRLALEMGHEEIGALLETASASKVGTKEARMLNAIQKADVPTVERLLAEGADPNACDQEGDPALVLAVKKSKPPLVQALVAKGANVNVRDSFLRRTPLMMAVDRPQSFQLLLTHGADLSLKDKEGKAAAVYALGRYGSVEVLRFLLDKGMSVEARYKGLTCLMWAAKQINLEAVKLLLERGANIHATDRLGNTALHHAVMWEGVSTYRDKVRPILETLVEKGANLQARNKEGEKPFQLAPGRNLSLLPEDFRFLVERTASEEVKKPRP